MSVVMWFAVGYLLIGMAAAHNFIKWTKKERDILENSARKNDLLDKVDPIINFMAVMIMLSWPWHAVTFRKKNTP